VLCIGGATAWYFLYFAKDVESLVGDCGGCYCIPDESTANECPSNVAQPQPQSGYPEETHGNAWKSQTILNPYELNCNPYRDEACDTEPPLDPNFEWAELGETAVCAVHYEAEDPQQRQRQRQRLLETTEAYWNRQIRREQQQSEEIDVDDDVNITLAEEEEIEIENDTCENTAFYRIKTYPSREDAESAGGFVTHVGNCGVCSTLQDLAVYANADLIGATSPGTFCRRQAATSFENGLACYRGLGLTQDCAKIWADTSWNTAKNCFGSCVLRVGISQFDDITNRTDVNSTETETSNNWYDLPAILRKTFSSSETSETGEQLAVVVPSNGPAPECALNDCITCNDKVSAPIFEKFAGRSRRRSGLLSTVARPCSSVPNIVQDPCPLTQPLPE